MSAPKFTHSGNSSRFGNVIAFGLKRFRDGDDNPLWRFYVSKYVGHDALIEEDATLPMLREMQRFIEAAIKTVASDGGRKTDEVSS